MTEQTTEPAQPTPAPPAFLRRYKIRLHRNPGSQTTDLVEVVGAGISFWSDGAAAAMLVVGDVDGNAVYSVPLNRVHSLLDPDHEVGGPDGDPIVPLRQIGELP